MTLISSPNGHGAVIIIDGVPNFIRSRKVLNQYGQLVGIKSGDGIVNLVDLFQQAVSVARDNNGPLLAIEDPFLTLGPELLSVGSGGFQSIAGITPAPGVNLSVVDGALRMTDVNAVGTYGNTVIPYVGAFTGQNVIVVIKLKAVRSFPASGLSFSTAGVTYNTVLNSLEPQRIVALPYTSNFLLRSNGGLDVNIESISVREILSAQVYQDTAGTLPSYIGGVVGKLNDLTGLGIHATQATAGNRPIISQVPKRVGPELNTVANNNWYYINAEKTGLVSVGENTKTTGWIPVQSGNTYRFLPNGVSSRRRCQFLALNGVTERHATEISAESSAFGYFTIPSNVSAVRIYYALPTDSAIDLSVREVLEWTDALTFDGSDDSLQLATNPIGANLSQPYTIICAGVVGALGARRNFYGDNCRVVGITNTDNVVVTHRGAADRPTTITVSQGQPVVVETTWNGTTTNIYVNGIVAHTSALAASTTSLLSATIGQSGGNTEFFNGKLTGLAVFDRVLSDSERQQIGRAFAKEIGVTYAV